MVKFSDCSWGSYIKGHGGKDLYGMKLQILRFVEAVAEHVADGCQTVTKEQLSERLTACQPCPHRGIVRCRHDDCGCFIWLKARWKSQKCPDNPPRWQEIIDEA